MNTKHSFTRQTTLESPGNPPDERASSPNGLLLSVKNSSGRAVPYWHTIGKRTFGCWHTASLAGTDQGYETWASNPRCNKQVKDPSCLIRLSPCFGRVCLTAGNEPTCQWCLFQGKVTNTDQRPDNGSGKTELEPERKKIIHNSRTECRNALRYIEFVVSCWSTQGWNYAWNYCFITNLLQTVKNNDGHHKVPEQTVV